VAQAVSDPAAKLVFPPPKSARISKSQTTTITTINDYFKDWIEQARHADEDGLNKIQDVLQVYTERLVQIMDAPNVKKNSPHWEVITQAARIWQEVVDKRPETGELRLSLAKLLDAIKNCEDDFDREWIPDEEKIAFYGGSKKIHKELNSSNSTKDKRCLWDGCRAHDESMHEMKTHILKKKMTAINGVYLCLWNHKRDPCGFTSLTDLSIMQHVWADHVAPSGEEYLGRIDDEWVDGQPPLKKLAAEWKKSKVPDHMLAGDTLTSPLTGELWWADRPPYYLRGDTVYSDHVTSEQMHLMLFSGKFSSQQVLQLNQLANRNFRQTTA
jgi:hypothetical protein